MDYGKLEMSYEMTCTLTDRQLCLISVPCVFHNYYYYFFFKWLILGRTGLTWTYRRPYATPNGTCGARTHDPWVLRLGLLTTAPSVLTLWSLCNL